MLIKNIVQWNMGKIISSKHENEAGFTLIELSIVLVIIGLIAGGVLVGRDLIHAAEIRSTVSQYEKYDSAVNTFRTKFNCLPGDCMDVANIGLPTVTPGNGDGYIGACNSSVTCSWALGGTGAVNAVYNEYYLFWNQLGATNLVNIQTPDLPLPGGSPNTYAGTGSPPTTITQNKMPQFGWKSAGWAVQAEPKFLAGAGDGSMSGHGFVIGSGNLYVSGGIYGAFYPADMQAIDQKVDDGLPFSGKARAYSKAQNDLGTDLIGFDMPGGVGTGGSSAAFCVRNDLTPFEYNVQYTDNASTGQCGLVIRASF